MKQYPSRLKFRKYHKPGVFFLKAINQKTFYPSYAKYALVSIDSGRLTYKQIEAGRRSIRRRILKKGKIYIRVFTYASITKRSVGMRMGKGKGSHSVWVSPIRAGQVIYELSGVSSVVASLALLNAADKMPFKCKLVKLSY